MFPSLLWIMTFSPEKTARRIFGKFLKSSVTLVFIP
jgi:hypothetical protein